MHFARGLCAAFGRKMKDIALPMLVGVAAYWLVLFRWALKRETTIRNHLIFWVVVVGVFLVLAAMAYARGEKVGAEIVRLLSFVFGLLLSAFLDRKNIRRRDSSYW
jgi:hypothetical protein